MLKMSEIRELVKLVDQTSVDELQLEKEDFRLCIRKTRPAAIVPPNTAAAGQAPTDGVQPVLSGVAVQAAGHVERGLPQGAAGGAAALVTNGSDVAGETGAARHDGGLHKIVSPMVGTFYRAPAPDAPPFVNPGDRVDEKTVVCIIEAMKLMNEIEAEVKGVIVDVLVENGQLVEYGQPLFLVKTD